MEKDQNRDIFLEYFDQFCDFVELTEKFLDSLRKYRSFRDNMRTVDRLEDINKKKFFIFLEFTRLRSTCEKIVEFLRESGSDRNILAALYLEKCNTSTGPQEYDFVVPAKSLMKGSLIYEMSRKPRGKCIIINNHVKYIKNTQFVDPTADGQFYLESTEFKSIFEQLYFKVDLINNVNTKQIREGLNSISKNSILDKTDALIVMIITHGANENILGFDACQGIDNNDLMPTSEVVDIFSEDNCTYLKNKPKLFFFNCCRINIPGNNSSMNTEKDGDLPLLNTLNNTQTTSDSFVCYSCSKGQSSWGRSGRMTLFGEALKRSLKQNSCQESLFTIMSRTCTLMDQLLPKYQNYKSTPEIRGHFMRRQLYFNPGFPE